MAKSRLFDNIMQVYRGLIVVAGTATQSVEIDLELPRGYVAKIHKVIMDMRFTLDLGVLSDTLETQCALVLDPDDAVTVQMPANVVEHDVLCDALFEIREGATTENGHAKIWTKQIDFSHLEGLDVITARNMRWNINEAAAQYDGSHATVTIYYTLEAIQDKQIMELLDIL